LVRDGNLAGLCAALGAGLQIFLAAADLAVASTQDSKEVEERSAKEGMITKRIAEVDVH